MKPFRVNRNAWHYKLNKHFLNERGDNHYYMEDRWEPQHNNFCSYWRVTMLRLLAAAVIVVCVVSLLLAVGFIIYENPWEAAKTVAAAIAFIVSIVATAAAIAGFSHLRDVHRAKAQNKQSPDSIFVMRYKAYKSKICPMVEYDK